MFDMYFSFFACSKCFFSSELECLYFFRFRFFVFFVFFVFSYFLYFSFLFFCFFEFFCVIFCLSGRCDLPLHIYLWLEQRNDLSSVDKVMPFGTITSIFGGIFAEGSPPHTTSRLLFVSRRIYHCYIIALAHPVIDLWVVKECGTSTFMAIGFFKAGPRPMEPVGAIFVLWGYSCCRILL